MKTIFKSLFAAAMLTGATLASPAMAAVSVGDTVTCTSSPFDCSVPTATIGNGTEFFYEVGNGAVNFLSFDFATNLLTIRSPVYVGFGGPQSITFQDLTNPFTSAVLTGNTTSSGFTQNSISLVNGLLNFRFDGLTVNNTGAITVALNGGPAAAAVPEAATWGMMILGFGMMGAAARYRRRGAKLAYA
ncbi:hypothetical protein ASG11_14270 [Sphingomonas sp. Leaf357]|uniref:PEPxxWA-CTERM sorting domain-containing protein n=1 Tax=Sphingomonas sp. Leaf357 TaxID=1736350 RepID=UPI0006FA6F9E|nr:PEPxxWA-CTERM sorting domain-containing protein [Sphingomonas sp. Leaf357]KQS01975.1 hypothetical protein ASG11_14270 [Sphingomonas sp. Leaf357]